MALRDPADKNLLRLEARRFLSRCEAAVSSIERADTLREVSRLASSVHLPFALSEDYSARDGLRLIQMRAEDRARELVNAHLQGFLRAEETQREKQRRVMVDALANLTGPLAHLHAWAQSKLVAAMQELR